MSLTDSLLRGPTRTTVFNSRYRERGVGSRLSTPNDWDAEYGGAWSSTRSDKVRRRVRSVKNKLQPTSYDHTTTKSTSRFDTEAFI